MADAELKHLNHHLKRKAGLESEEEAMARKHKQEQKERNTTLAYSAIAALTGMYASRDKLPSRKSCQAKLVFHFLLYLPSYNSHFLFVHFFVEKW
jgi:hypothetical protein